MSNMLGVYQNLYSNTDYGKASKNRCPGVRYLPKYLKHLKGPVIDLGCGTGDTVRDIRAKGFEAQGIDQITRSNMLVGDICSPLDLSSYATSICIDVFEHIVDLSTLIANMQQTERQVISVFSGSSIEGVELHTNIKSIKSWDNVIKNNFKIVSTEILARNRKLYLCTSMS